jgi:TonB-linked SusC/RagA family outer membrane protein
MKQLIPIMLPALLLCCSWRQELGAQVPGYADATPVRAATARLVEKPRALKKVFAELESRFNVRFAFDERLVAGIEVPDYAPGPALEPTLDRVLAPTNLAYRKIKSDLYVIQVRESAPLLPARGSIGVLEREVRTITGQVVDEANEPLVGVTVALKGTATGTATDADGRFSLQVPDEGGTLVFSYTGFASQEITIGTENTVTVRMLESATNLSEIIVTGYQSQQRGDIISSIGVVNTQEMQKVQAATLGEMLGGRVAGVNVVSSGVPGQSSSIKIRGTSSLLGQDAPLYVIDGMFINSVEADFNPNDIESVQVLKDAAATALYGSRGMNGVIVITTKKGKKGAPRINYNAYTGVQNVPKRLPLANAAQFIEIATLAYENNGETPPNFTTGVDTDWQEEFFQQGSINEHNLSFSGASDNASYLISGNFFDQEGIVKGPDFRRYALRVNSELQRGIFRFGENIYLSTADQTRVNGLPFIDVLRMTPTIPVYDETTNSGFGYGSPDNPTFGTNPIALQEHYSNTGHTNKAFGSIFGELTLLRGLTYRLNLGLDYATVRSRYFERAGRIRMNNPDLGPAFLNNESDEFFNTLAENTLNFNRTFGERHDISALVGYTTQRDQRTYLFAHTEGIDGEFWVQNAGTSSPRTNGYTDIAGLRSWLGSINYSFDDRYLVGFNIRRDGSSRFGKDNQWANFPSASVGWRVSREPFLADSRSISDLKLRASYGTVGNQAIPNYATAATIYNNLNYPLNGTVLPGASNRRLVNENLRWESKTTVNAGLDLGLFNNRVIFNLDWFRSRTTDLLVEVPVPLSSGNNGPNPYDNLASIENRGIELALTYQNNLREFNYRLTGNFTQVRNEVIALIEANGNQPIFGYNQITRTALGSSVGAYWGLKTDGVFQNQAEIDGSAQPDAQPGDLRFVDTDGNGLIDFEDRQELGSPFPDFEYGLNLNLGWRGLDLTAFFNGVAGNTLYNEGNWWLGRYDDLGNYRTDVSYWTGAGTSSTVPRPRHGDPTRNWIQQTDRWLEPGDYFRLRTLQIGYTLPASLFNRALSSLRLYLTGQNIFTITDYSGYDPEIIGASPAAGSGRDSWFGRGIDAGNFPVPKTYSVGLQVGF